MDEQETEKNKVIERWATVSVSAENIQMLLDKLGYAQFRLQRIYSFDILPSVPVHAILYINEHVVNPYIDKNLPEADPPRLHFHAVAPATVPMLAALTIAFNCSSDVPEDLREVYNDIKEQSSVERGVTVAGDEALKACHNSLPPTTTPQFATWTIVLPDENGVTSLKSTADVPITAVSGKAWPQSAEDALDEIPVCLENDMPFAVYAVVPKGVGPLGLAADAAVQAHDYTNFIRAWLEAQGV
ncbi:hypothetical protein J8273_0335 [Carpediemonas membranifera]|uniref:Uncharacterized protein n=1 Tax=Carpediemonas membranifera TaxID=201153 RepID=A0A8J6AUK2_9EUKA|nr:hypothetical protein J8273_0335 [Carpediemonas membranifera]|eukprot:KAG9395116.1 hypothetical protein J8273_0335 [Carpediemonas membranifera]